MGDYLLIIDGSGLLSTHYYGNLPRQILFAKTKEEKERYYDKIMMTKNGVYTNGVYGFLRALLKILKQQNPKYLAICWDLTRDTFRRSLYTDYKANRDETPEPLIKQFDLCMEVFQRIGIRQFMDTTYEADDYAGTLARAFEQEIPVRILTRDRDYLQLVNDRTHLFMLQQDDTKVRSLIQKYNVPPEAQDFPEKTFELDEARVFGEYEVTPEMVPSLKGLEGDPSDNITGVPGVGEKTAIRLVKAYKTIDRLYQVLHEDLPEKEEALKQHWKEDLGIPRPPFKALTAVSDQELVGEKAARLSENLATIRRDVPLNGLTLEDLKTTIKENALREVLSELEFHSLLTDGLFETAEEPLLKNVRRIEDFEAAGNAVKALKKQPLVGISYSPGIGMAVASENGETLFFPELFFLNADAFRQFLQDLQASGTVLSSFDGKSLVKSPGISTEDVSIMGYLLDPLSNAYAAPSLLKTWLPKLSFNEKADLEETLETEAAASVRLHPVLSKKLKESGMDTLYRTIELPTMAALAHMEQTGIRVEKQALADYSALLLQKIEALSSKIYEEAGEVFNINSPKQLAGLLFEKLSIPYGKKPKNGYSTAADVLEKFRDDYPIVADVLDYRLYAKLRSTYAEGLKEYIQPDGRIYGSFHQTVTATGRISSTNPNLQNIPVRTELGQEFRKLFVPEEGHVFIDADFSQIELRVLASLSEDEHLIEAFLSGVDIHTQTASQIFHVPVTDVTAEMRRSAKAVNFGIVYGISAYSLSEDLKISKDEAEAYMAGYFATYPKVQAYLKRTVEKAAEDGFVKTLYGRVRPVPELKSSNFHQRSFGERVAMNSPIQGTAADIMKRAVIRVEQALKDAGMRSRIVLQVHDEILLEAPEAEAEHAEALLVREMQGAADLSVPLLVEAKEGRSWYETKG